MTWAPVVLTLLSLLLGGVGLWVLLTAFREDED